MAICKTLYEIVDLDDELELPMFSGTMTELSEFTGFTNHYIHKAIYWAKKKGCRCRYVRVDLDTDEQFEVINQRMSEQRKGIPKSERKTFECDGIHIGSDGKGKWQTKTRKEAQPAQ